MSSTNNLPAPPANDDGWEDAAKEASSSLIRGILIKFGDWRWTKGAESEEVAIGTQLVAVGTAAAWVYWNAGKPDPNKYVVRQPGKALPNREELSEHDQTLW